MAADRATDRATELSIILHGGVLSQVEISENEKRIPVLGSAMNAGWALLCAGAPGEQAVVAALKVLEECEYFDAGYGAFPNEEGQVLLDAALMRGDGKFISLLNVSHVRFPSEVALELLRNGDSRMRVWNDRLLSWLQNAPRQLRDRVGLVADPAELISPYAKLISDHFSSVTKQQNLPLSDTVVKGTVGCVVRDSTGTIVAGTSTGGTPAKPVGRIGDSPLIGVGTFANNEIGGLSMTGHGESLMSSLLPGLILGRMRDLTRDATSPEGLPTELLQNMLRDELNAFKRDYPNRYAGLIALPGRGQPVFDFEAAGMGVALRYGIKDHIRHQFCDVVSR